MAKINGERSMQTSVYKLLSIALTCSANQLINTHTYKNQITKCCVRLCMIMQHVGGRIRRWLKETDMTDRSFLNDDCMSSTYAHCFVWGMACDII